jgi:Flp pilus assembly protein TadD
MTGRGVLLLLSFVGSAWAGVDNEMAVTNHTVRVHVLSPNQDCDSSLRVELQNGSGTAAQGLTDRSCSAMFMNVASGTYSVSVAGVDAGQIALDSFDNEVVDVNVEVTRPLAGRGTKRAPSVDVADLKVPLRAAREYEKASQLINKQEWKSALEHLQKAVRLYPSYVAAYNSMGIVYAREGDRTQEREALQKAISLNDRYIPAFVNLGRLGIATNDFADAETQLHKASALDPSDGVILVLLAYAEFGNRHFDDAIASCGKVHAMAHISHAGAHWVAALAFEQKDQLAEAAAEFEVFLNEEQTGSRADLARKELTNIKDFLASNQQGNSKDGAGTIGK